MQYKLQNGYWWRRALVISTIVSAAILSLIVAIWASPFKLQSSQNLSYLRNGGQFSLTSRQELESTYLEAWYTVRQSFFDENKLANWQQWEHAYDGQLRTQQQLQSAIKNMLSDLGDQYSALLTTTDLAAFEQAHSNKLIGIGVNITNYSISGVLSGGPAQKAGLKGGEQILAVDGQSVSSMTPQEMINRILSGVEGTPVELTIKVNSTVTTVSMKRAVIATSPAVRYLELSLPQPAGVIRIDNLRADDALSSFDAGLRALKDKPGLILDLRGSQGGEISTAVKIAARFLNNGTIANSVQRTGGMSIKGSYALQDSKVVLATTNDTTPAATITVMDSPNNLYSGKLVVLVDDQTSGAAEIIAAALQENHRAVVVGMPTQGKGNGQIIKAISKEYALRLTNSVYFTPGMHPIESVGIKPDVKVDPARRDQMFSQAEAELLKQLGQ